MSPEQRLQPYAEKRRAGRTPEPLPSGRQPRRLPPHEPSFVVQEHHARRLHYDFRLEREGVLVSWAVPKGLPRRPGVQRLAVQTEDHPLEYAAFQGEIPAGEYGAGTVRLFDHGVYQTEKWRQGEEVIVVLSGQLLRGTYVLVHTDANRWLVHKMTAEAARRAAEAAPRWATEGGRPPGRAGA